MTTTEPDAGDQKRGRHAKREDVDRPADPTSEEREPAHAADDDVESEGEVRNEPEHDEPEDDAPTDDAPEEEAAAPPPPSPVPSQRPAKPEDEPKQRRAWHSVQHHPAGASLLTASGLVTGLALAPLLFDKLNFEISARAADAVRSAATPWPGGGEPWFWPGWMALTALVVAVVVLVVGAIGVRVPDVAVLVTALVLAATTGRAAWATLDVVNAHLWELIPACIVCVFAFGSAVAAAIRWRSGDRAESGSGAGEVAGVTVGAWLLVVLLFLGGSAIASSAQTHAFGNVTSPPQDLAGLLSVRAADAPQVHDLQGRWVPQVAAAQVTDDATASAYAVGHHDWTTRFPTLLARGDDVGAPGLDDTWWLSIVAQPFSSGAEAAAWCSSNGVAACTPLLVSG